MWTESRVEYLCELKSQGLTRAEIGKRMGISRSAVIGKLDRMQDPSHRSQSQGVIQKWTQEEIDLLTKAWPTKQSTASIAQTLKRSPGSVRHKADDLGLRRPERVTRPYTPRPKKIKPFRAPKPLPVPPIPDPDYETCIGLLDLKLNSCRWPTGEPVKYCGAKSHPLKPYCPGHMARAYGYQPPGKPWNLGRYRPAPMQHLPKSASIAERFRRPPHG
jgi:GcrA cell cycle regulator